MMSTNKNNLIDLHLKKYDKKSNTQKNIIRNEYIPADTKEIYIYKKKDKKKTSSKPDNQPSEQIKHMI